MLQSAKFSIFPRPFWWAGEPLLDSSPLVALEHEYFQVMCTILEEKIINYFKGTVFELLGTQASRMMTLKPDEESVSSEDDAGLFGSLFGRGSLRSKFNKKTPKQFTAVSIAKSSNAGWGPVNVTMSGSPDPMLQQMDIIKGYIRQAKQERRFEEVELFEQNLKELELEYMKQRHGKWSFAITIFLIIVRKSLFLQAC